MIPLVAVLALAPRLVAVTPPAFSEAVEPQVAVEGDHQVYVVYGIGSAVYLSKSQDGGKSYGKPSRVGELTKLALGMRRGPRIVVHRDVVTITAISHHSGDLVAFRSADRGITWSPAVRVNDVAGAAREGLHAMAAAPDGTLAATWLDLRSKGTKIYVATSKDGGANWSSNRLVYESPSGSVCECCHPSAAYDSKGKLFIMFRNSLGGSRDMYLTSSADGGRTFTRASKLGHGTWKLDGCPMDGGAFVFSSTGQLESVWRREGTVYRSSVGQLELMLAEGRQPWIAATDVGAFITWSDGSRILCSTPTERVAELSRNGRNSVVAASPDGKLVIAAWTESGIQAARL